MEKRERINLKRDKENVKKNASSICSGKFNSYYSHYSYLQPIFCSALEHRLSAFSSLSINKALHFPSGCERKKDKHVYIQNKDDRLRTHLNILMSILSKDWYSPFLFTETFLKHLLYENWKFIALVPKSFYYVR